MAEIKHFKPFLPVLLPSLALLCCAAVGSGGRQLGCKLTDNVTEGKDAGRNSGFAAGPRCR